MKKRLACFIFAAAMVLSLPAAAFAADTPTLPTEPIESGATVGGEASVMSVNTSTISADRTSATSGKISAYATFSGTATTATCIIYLQEKYNGSWRAATGLGTTSYTKTVSNSKSITAGKTFTLKSGKTYRAKVVISARINGTLYGKTHYSGAF